MRVQTCVFAQEFVAACALVLLVCTSDVVGARLRRKPSLRSGASDTGNATGTGAVDKLKSDYPFYHTTAEISAELRRLTARCQNADLEVESREDKGVKLEIVRVKGKGAADPANRVLLISGEHARELIGPESSLRFLQALCGDADVGADSAPALADSEFLVVVNANPGSRVGVEKGDYCLRANPNGVDLNRNWDEHWDAPMTLSTSKGESAFSEPETRILKDVALGFKPTAYISVHSGTLGMYMPWAWSTNRLAGRNQGQMMELLESLDAKHCQCPFGAAGKEVGYSCPGTSVDYVYDKLNASFSFAFEIWGSPSDIGTMRQRWKDKISSGGQALLQMGASLDHPHFQDIFRSQQSDFVHVGEARETSLIMTNASMGTSLCFGMFNPTQEHEYKEAVDNWASLYLELSSSIARMLRP